MKLKISLNNYCRLCAIGKAGNGQLLDCEEVLFDEKSSKTTIKDLVKMYLPDLLRDKEDMLLPRKICVGCVKAILNWADFFQRSLNSHNYFMKLLSRDFEIPKDNSELVNFIRTTKEEFSLTLVRSISRLSPQGRVLLRCSAPTINTSSKKAPPSTNTSSKKLSSTNTSSKKATTVIDSPPNKALNLLYRSCDKASLNNEVSPVKKGESISRKPTSERNAVDRLSVEQDSADSINTSSKKTILYGSPDKVSADNEVSPFKRGESILKKHTSELNAVDRLSVEQDSADSINTLSKNTVFDGSPDKVSADNEVSPFKRGESILKKHTSELNAVDRLSVEQDSADSINTLSKNTVFDGSSDKVSADNKVSPFKRGKSILKKCTSELNAVDTLSAEQESVDSSSLPAKRKPARRNRLFIKKRNRSKKKRKETCECVMCSTNQSAETDKCDGTPKQQCVFKKDSTPSHDIGHPKPFLDAVRSWNFSPINNSICSPSIMLYQEVIGANDPIESDNQLDVDNLVDGSTDWVYRLERSEMAFVLESYNLDSRGNYFTLRNRLLNHLKRFEGGENQIPIPDAQKPNIQCDDDDDYDEDLENGMEVLPNADSDPIVRDHSYSKEAPPGYFRLEDQLFKPRGSGPINMEFFIGMSNFWTEDSIRKMGKAEILNILEICNIESTPRFVSLYELKNRLVRYLNYIRAQPTSVAGGSTDYADRTLLDGCSAPSLEDSNREGYPSDQSDDIPFKGFESIYATNDVPGNTSDQSSESPFKGFEYIYARLDSSVDSSVQSDSPFKGFQSRLDTSVNAGDDSPCRGIANLVRNEASGSCVDADPPVTIKTEVTSDNEESGYYNMELNIKEECIEEYSETAYSPLQGESALWMSDDIPHYPVNQYPPNLNQSIHSELTEYFRTHHITADINRFKCWVALEKLHPAIISFYCSPNFDYSSSSTSSSSSSSSSCCSSSCLSSCSSSSSSTLSCPSLCLSPVPTPRSPYNTTPPELQRFEDLS